MKIKWVESLPGDEAQPVYGKAVTEMPDEEAAEMARDLADTAAQNRREIEATEE